MLISISRVRKSALALSILALIANTLISATPASASSVLDGNVNCSTSGTFTVFQVAVTTSSLCTGAAVLPDGIVSIAPSAFQGATELTSVTFPVSVTSIGEGSFRSTGLTSVVLPERLISLGNSAFMGTELTTVNFPDYLTSIGNSAFMGTELTTVNFPRSLSSIGANAFSGLADLTTVTFAHGSDLTSIGEGAFSETGLTQISIPANVEVINNNAFKAAGSLTRVTFEPGSFLVTIGDRAFEGTAVTEIIIPFRVTSIGQWAFYDAKLLASITFQRDEPVANPTAQQEISSAAFSNIGSLVTGGTTAFVYYDATGFVTADVSGVQKWLGLNVSRTPNIPCVAPSPTVPGSIKVAGTVAVGDSACRGTVPIPSSIREFGDEFLSDAGAVTHIEFASGSQLTRVGAYSFQDASALVELTLPAGVVEIGREAFKDADHMVSLDLPASLRKVGQRAFYSVDLLMNVTFRGNAPLVVSDSFDVRGGAFAHVTAEATGFSLGDPRVGGVGTTDSPLYFCEDDLVIKRAAAVVVPPAVQAPVYQDTTVITPPVVLPPVVLPPVEAVFVPTAKAIALGQSVLKSSARGVPVLRGAASAKAITFAPYSAKLTTANLRALQKIAASFEGEKGTLVVTGFVKYEGRPLALDRKLSLARAKGVSLALLKYGIDVHVGYTGFGPHNKRSPKSTDRRVEFRWVASN